MYAPLPRPHDHRRATPYPAPPPSLVGMEGVDGVAPAGALARVAQRLGLSLGDLDETLTVSDVLNELDLQAYLFDVDNPPAERPAK